MYKFLFSIGCLFAVITSRAQQNLVPNGNFEEYNNCPSVADGYFLYTAGKDWTTPTSASPDYCNACSNDYDSLFQRFKYSVPQNYYGYQEAHSGDGYAAIACQQNADGTHQYIEYIQVELSEPLQEGKLYEVRFFVHNPKYLFCINSVSALFTSSELNLNTTEMITLSPQITSNPNVFFRDTTAWYEVKEYIRATGDEKFLTIGLFKKFPELKVIHFEGWVPVFETMWGILYIDDVSIIEKGPELANIFTPNGDGLNDSYKLDLKLIGASNAVILNRWGNVIAEGDTLLNWDGTFEGSNCPDGVYFIKIEFENRTENQTIELIR
ncbi:hypothetical protein D3C71_753780 [compost metagenome]